jgi:hypothetical protein
VTISGHPARIEHGDDKCKLARLVSACRTAGKARVMEALTPASPGDLPPLGELIADEPFWRYPLGPIGREGVAHLRVWLTARPKPGHLAVVTETGSAAEVTESAGSIWAVLARRFGSSLVLLEHHLAPEDEERAETLDLVRVGLDGSPRWLRVWPTREENPRHAGLERWMAVHGYQIVTKPASAFDWCEDEGG